jgi:hypothetical protein
MTCTDSNRSSPELAPGSNKEEHMVNNHNKDENEGNGIGSGSDDGDPAGERCASDNDNDTSHGPGASGTQDVTPLAGTSVS